MAGNRIEFTINANQTKTENLQFIAQSVIVDNPNSYYVYFSYLRRWVLPFTAGAVLKYGVQPSIAAFETDLLPPDIIPPYDTVIDTGAKVIFVEDVIPENGGSATQVGLVSNVNVVTGSTIIATQNPADTYRVSVPNPLPVSAAQYDTSPRPTDLLTATFSLSLGASASTIVIGATGFRIYLYEWYVYAVGVGGGGNPAVIQLKSSYGAIFAQTRTDATGPSNMPLHGRSSPYNNDNVNILNTSSVAAVFSGHLIYASP